MRLKTEFLHTFQAGILGGDSEYLERCGLEVLVSRIRFNFLSHSLDFCIDKKLE